MREPGVRIPPVIGMRARSVTWARLLLSVAWACFPAFLFYLLVLQPPVLSRSRLALSAILVPVFAAIAYRTLPRVRQSLSRTQRLALLAGSALLSLLAAVPLSQASTKTYLFGAQHSLRVEVVKVSAGQQVELRWFHTSLGDISLDSVSTGDGWQRKGDVLGLSSGPASALTWRGWTGGQSTLAFTGTPGSVIRVSWDGVARTIDFAQTGGRADFTSDFALPWWQLPALVLLLWGATLYFVVVPVLHSQIRFPEAYLPAWIGWTLLLAPFFALMFLVWNSSLDDLQLPLVLSLSSFLVAPVYVVIQHLPRQSPARNLAHRAANLVQRHPVAATLACTSILVIAIFGRSIWTNWAVADDHEILLFVGPGRSLSLAEMFRYLPFTEAGQFGAVQRFRPTYWFLRLLESVVWGANPYYWHAFRVLIMILATAALWRLVSRQLGWLTAGVLCAYTLTFPYWREIIGWLGPGETYAVLGLPPFLWGMTVLMQARDSDPPWRRAGAGAGVVLGGILAVGSKESFVLLAIPSLYLAFQGARAKDPIALVAGLACLLFAAYVGTSVILALSKAGVDVYSHSVALPDRVAHVLGGLKPPDQLAPFANLAALILVPAAVLATRGHSRETTKAAGWGAFWIVTFIVIYLSQLAFYNGDWPTGTRYDFPGLLYVPGVIYLAIRLTADLIPPSERAIGIPTAQAALGIGLAILLGIRGYGPTIGFLNGNVESTQAFVSRVERISSILRAHDDYALVVESNSVSDFEAIYSYEAFLRSYNVRNNLFLRLHGFSASTSLYEQESRLAGVLEEVSMHGNGLSSTVVGLLPLPRQGDVGYSPLAELSGYEDRCYSLLLSYPVATECETIP